MKRGVQARRVRVVLLFKAPCRWAWHPHAVQVTCMLTTGCALMHQGKQQQVRELVEKLEAARASAAKQEAAAAANEEALAVRVRACDCVNAVGSCP
jgi:hypothetical protein